jgi:hypothetical protein
MQQATQKQDQPPAQATVAVPVPAANSFVINLFSATSPVALSPPDHAGLKRFTFFVSRRREDGRERFRLHMGYFETQEEAEKLLDIVREIYPGAWAGLAPGQRLRAAAAAAKISSSAPTANADGAAAAVAAAPIPAPAVPAPAVEASPFAPPAAVIPAPTPAATPALAASASSAPKPVPEEVSFQLIPDNRGRPVPAADPASVPTASQAASQIATPVSDETAAASSLSNVRAAIDSLSDTAVGKPALRIPELKAAVPAPRKAIPKPAPTVEELSDEGTIALLESPAAPALDSMPNDAAKGSSASDNSTTPPTEKALFAVQLVWSVQPIDIASVPQLAIFSAYTLYGAEGNRDGRRWYGLRLGFFTDAVSAKQVAHYVRSEFSTVSVVPVTSRERERAKLATARAEPVPTTSTPVATAPAAAAPAVPLAGKVGKPVAPAPAVPVARVPGAQFEFIEDKPLTPAVANAVVKPAGRTGRGAPGKRAKLRNPAQVAAHAKPKKLTLEETLEILGAGDLKVDEGRGELLNHDGAKESRPQPAKAKPSRLGRLFERLSERIGN